MLRRRVIIAAAATRVVAAAIYSGVESEQMANYVFTDEFNGPATVNPGDLPIGRSVSRGLGAGTHS